MIKFKYWVFILLSLILATHLTACSKKQSDDSAVVADATTQDATGDEKLGTKWGDELTSNVSDVDLKRLKDEPIAQSAIRYANKNYQGKSVNSLSIASGTISFSVVDDQMNNLPLFRDGQQYYLSAKEGQSYQLHYQNHSDKTYEIVASVDGLDVLNGQEASVYSSGYVLYPQQTLTIEGFRKSDSAVASFTFGKPDESYAANSNQGSVNNVGIIGTVVYELESEAPVAADAADEYAPPPNAFPADKKK